MLKYILLGLTQGLTEFLPVSSSGHLVILQKVLGLSTEELTVTIILHLATALSLVIFFFKDILKLLREKELLGKIILVTLVTGLIGFLGKDFFESLFSSVRLVAAALILTGVILILTKRIGHNRRKDLRLKDAFILGLAQGAAIAPGLSRSGITISVLLFRGLDRETSFQFSFLAAIPVILGASFLEAEKIGFALHADFTHLAVAFIVSLLSGLFALWLLRALLRKAKFHYFGYYCIFIAVLTLFFIK